MKWNLYIASYKAETTSFVKPSKYILDFALNINKIF